MNYKILQVKLHGLNVEASSEEEAVEIGRKELDKENSKYYMLNSSEIMVMEVTEITEVSNKMLMENVVNASGIIVENFVQKKIQEGLN